MIDVRFEENDEISKLPWMSVNVVRHRLLDAVSKQKGEIGSYKDTY